MKDRRRKSEVIILRDNKEGIKGAFEAIRIAVDLPWDTPEKLIGYMSNNVLMDITGVLEDLERFKQMLQDIKGATDCINNETLLIGE